ncbi:LamG domain-containing protein [Salinibacter ruber]|uniref:LamG domain-containing protein n=1 Tax=Salinibacter ruber TaxID=146919 RepID=UPI00216A6C1C|nr:LamG domain-containing protein [Salinibacter ruber]MCS4039327.1 hypothetical protein [Salinibacter ruber]
MEIDPGYVQEPDYDTFPNDEKLGREVIDCNYETGGTPGQCGADGDICAFTMSGDQNAHIADCDQDKLPPSTSYKGTLCCSVKELCYDGKDNDGDGLVDCADPECNGAGIGSPLDPFGPDNSPGICHNASSCPQTVHVGLEGYWQFENATNDSTTNENDISSTTGTEFTNHLRGKLGQALAFDPGDQATVPDDTSFFETLDPEEALTVAAYVNPETDTGTILDKDTYELYLSGGEARFRVETPGATTINLGSVPQDQWTHLIGTYNATTGDVTGYVDGTSTASASTSGNLSGSTSDVVLGNGTAGPYDGRIDEARIYSRELDSTEASSFTNPKCQNRQRTIECINNPELCNTSYGSESGYHCSFGPHDDPTNTGYDDGTQGTGVCCPKDQFAEYQVGFGWTCGSTDQCAFTGTSSCNYDINANESAWFASRSNGTADACNSQVNKLNEDLDETTRPEGSQACCQVPKKGVVGYWYKDGNVKIYG